MKGEGVKVINSAVLKFGVDNIRPATLEVIPGCFIVGAVCGLMGAVFVLVNSNLGLIRKKHINSNWKKLTEACLFSLMTTSCFYWFPSFLGDCESTLPVAADNLDIIVQYNCPEG